MLKQELTLKDFAGQRCDVVIHVRTNGSSYATFRAAPGYGYPSLEIGNLEELLEKMKSLESL